MERKKQRNYASLTVAIFCAGLLIATMNPLVSQVFKNLFSQDSLIHQNEAYLKGLAQEDEKQLLQLAEIRSLLYVLQSGDMGISFIVQANVEVGQALAPLSHVTDRTFEVVFTSLSATTFLRWFSELSEFIAPTIGMISLVSLFLFSLYSFGSLINPRIHTALKRITELSLLLFVMVHLLLPYSIHGAALISDTLYKDLRSVNRNNLTNMHQSLSSNSRHGDYKTRVKYDIGHMEAMLKDLPHKVESMISYRAKYLMFRVMSTIVMPLGLFLVLLGFFKYIVLPLCLPEHRRQEDPD